MIRALPILPLILLSVIPSGIAQDATKRPAVENIALSLRSEVLRKELEVTDEQTRKLMEIRIRIETHMSSYVHRLASIPEKELMQHQADFRSQMAAFNEEAAKVLAPSQLDRLSKIVASQTHHADKVDGGLLRPEMTARLGLSPVQTAEIERKIKEIEPKLAAHLEELEETMRREKSMARDSLLKLLTKEQRDQYEELLGQRFGE